MADIEGSLNVLQGLHKEQFIGGDDSLYNIYEPTNTSYYTDYYFPEDSNCMISGCDYPQPVCHGYSDIDDSHDSDDSSVVLDISDLEMIELFESSNRNFNIKSEANEQCYQMCGYPQYKTTPPVNNLPAFETLFPGKRTGSTATRLYNTPTDSEDDEESNSICRKGKRGAKNVLLWKFLLEELKIGKHVEWTDISQGTFRFVDTSEISRLWGLKKRKDDMNFEKLSRGIRHYYKSGFMSRQEGTRLIYKFDWAKVPKKYRQYDVKRGLPMRHMPY